MTKEEFINYCKKININIDNDKLEKLDMYSNLLVEWNKKFNLTSILDMKEIYLLHFYDSLCINKTNLLSGKIKLCDFGTGAGFPGMIIAIFYENIDVTLIESNQKKCVFLNEIINKLNLKNAKVICDRVENFGKEKREIFDIVTCRAVTSIPMIVELSTSILNIGGYLVPLKTDCKEELKNYKNLYNEIGLKLEKIIEYNLPINGAIRMIPIFKKLIKTSKKYPQNYSKIVKKYKY